MSIERQGFPGEWRGDRQTHEIQLGVPFRPFRFYRRFRVAGEGFSPLGIPESRDYVLVLRQPVSLYGMTGCVDIIDEDPQAQWTTFDKRTVMAQPMGIVGFYIDYHGPDDQRITESPYILRFGFLAKTPAQYTRLLNSYVEVKLGKREFVGAWNLGRVMEKRIMQRLEGGKETLVVEKNLFPLEELNARRGPVDGEEKVEDFYRIAYVWLPRDIKKFRTIEMTFNQFFDRDEDESTEIHIDPEKDKILVRA